MTKTFAVMAVLGGVCLLVGCDEDKKPEGAATTASVASTPPQPPPPPPKASPAEAIAKTMSSIVGNWNSHDPAKIAAGYEPTGKLVIPGLPEFKGKDAITAEAKDTFTAYPDFKLAITRSYTKGNTVALEWVITGKNDGPSMGQKPTGRNMGVSGASVLTFDDDGLVKEDHRYLDLPTIQSQLDPKAKPGSFRAVATLPAGATEDKTSKGTPDEAKTLDAAKAVYTAFEKKGGMDSMTFVTDDSVFDDYSMPATMKGPKPIKDWVGMIWTAVPDFTETKPVQFAVGDIAITEGNWVGTHKGALGPIKATNKPVSVRFVDFVQMKDGKAVHLDTYSNSMELLVEIGAMPAPGAPPAGSAAAAGSGAPASPSAMAASSAKPK
jgi:predicted ester cyclase